MTTTASTSGRTLDLTKRAVLSVPEAGAVLGLGRSASYEAVRRREIPSLRIGRRILVPVPQLLALLEGVQASGVHGVAGAGKSDSHVDEVAVPTNQRTALQEMTDPLHPSHSIERPRWMRGV